jgi:hypothetical protein
MEKLKYKVKVGDVLVWKHNNNDFSKLKNAMYRVIDCINNIRTEYVYASIITEVHNEYIMSLECSPKNNAAINSYVPNEILNKLLISGDVKIINFSNVKKLKQFNINNIRYRYGFFINVWLRLVNIGKRVHLSGERYTSAEFVLKILRANIPKQNKKFETFLEYLAFQEIFHGKPVTAQYFINFEKQYNEKK